MSTEIRNRKRLGQIVSFTGMEMGNCHPTDIDAIVEWKDKGYVFFEVKYKDAPFPTGQRLMLERLVDDVSGNKYAVALVVEHSVSDPDVFITLSECTVRESYTKASGWRYLDNKMSARQAMDYVIKRAEGLNG